jgi:hypothetical protein
MIASDLRTFSYNATTASFPSYDDVPLQTIIDAAMVNQASLWAAYYAVSPHSAFCHTFLILAAVLISPFVTLS